MAYTTINDPTAYFNTVLYTGNGSDNHTITGVGFQPDMIWIKERNSTSSHYLTSVGLGIGTRLEPDGTSAKATEGISAVTSDGFTIGTSTNQVNQNTINHVAWNWLAGGSPSSNSDGSITTSVSASVTAGFSIVTWTGTYASSATLGHGLGAVPKWILVKTLDRTENWVVYHVGNDATAPEDKSIRLDGNNAVQDNATHFNDTAPTSSVFSVGQSNGVNPSGEGMIAYCWAEKKGYSKFGSYTGNGNADGTFVYTGFKPAWVLIKQSSAANEEWQLLDNKRNTFNPTNTALFPSDTAVENSGNDRSDFLSNGFKCRSTSAGVNSSGSTYIYMAFAEAPFVSSGGIPTTAK